MQTLRSRFMLLFLLLTPLFVQAAPQPLPAPVIPHVVPSAPQIAGTSHLLIDFDSGKVLAEKDANQRIEPASLTKIMTGYVVINELTNGNMSMDEMVTISKKAWKMPGSKMFIEVGKQVSVRDLIKGMVIQSGNDASVALAEHIAGSEEVFAQLMNKYAKALGMEHTHFMNATGLPNPDHYTTAHDLAILTKALISKFPEEYKWYSEKKFTYNGITQYNRNKLLWQDPTVDGLKTGHTETAGYCLVSSAKRDNMRLISVVLGTNSMEKRVQESQKLLNYGFRFFETHPLYKAQQRLNDVTVWEGSKDILGVGLAHDLYVTIPRGQYKDLKIETTLEPEIIAPIETNQPLGELQVSLNGEVIAEQPLVALSNVEEGSFFKKLIDQIKRTFSSLFSFLD
ncbi:D-alanyl-D-alanine carboxypeptidase [Thiomicrorhabdus sp. ZW0627]|uniref:D-alanyl-D-alanine carboxypeptidase family protein n=1 Tax=Thiomicrorhabdus sp. ZW0627 TaxID=3039774 RepID=UPI0024368E92|nr:D-alanyl-D-alanine carboxypeptidase [Thiomicrorhabdus sp. ZW0627]MDG6773502.1 D-alanyl-D-alanine carboxypeptidase [Thiomicrorhabdus sp. ZW0627]